MNIINFYPREIFEIEKREMRVHEKLLRRNNNGFQDVIRSAKLITGYDKSDSIMYWYLPDCSESNCHSNDDFWCRKFTVYKDANTYLLKKIDKLPTKIFLSLGDDGPLYLVSSNLVMRKLEEITWYWYTQEKYQPFVINTEGSNYGYGISYCPNDNSNGIFQVFGWGYDR
ncbi:hypothetical protein [Candidatus Uabimicrobium sp. HlEnr_7]|uniref:hypothetical protein n=1 Tax=Candidatus Uabimicrobium helgolandensis TaxID=3095367 RepID=UPI003556988D